MNAVSSELIVAVGTTNVTKINAVKATIEKLFPQYSSFKVLPASVPSGVSDQPMTDEETINGATNRAKGAIEKYPEARFGIGLEGGIQQTAGRYYESCWVVVQECTGKLGIGCSAKFELSSRFMEHILAGEELATVIDKLSGQTDVRSSQGAMGIVTNGALCRTESMTHGIIFAFATFLSDARYWD